QAGESVQPVLGPEGQDLRGSGRLSGGPAERGLERRAGPQRNVTDFRKSNPMPELPDIVVYVECLERRTVGQVLRQIRLFNPFLLRSYDPPLAEAEGRTVRGLRRLGKRIVFELDDELFLILHLMIAGRL